MLRSGGEHHLGVGHAGECGHRGPAGIKDGPGRFGRDVSADLGLMPRMPGGRVEHGEALPRARGAVQV